MTWTDSFWQVLLMELLPGARNEVPTHHRSQQLGEKTGAQTGSGLAQGPSAELTDIPHSGLSDSET